MLAYFFSYFLRGEAHGSNVVGAQGQLTFRGLHELHCGTVAVSNVHHRKTCVRSQVTLVMACAEGVVKNLDSVVCGTQKVCTKKKHIGHVCLIMGMGLPVVPPPGLVLAEMTPG